MTYGFLNLMVSMIEIGESFTTHKSDIEKKKKVEYDNMNFVDKMKDDHKKLNRVLGCR